MIFSKKNFFENVEIRVVLDKMLRKSRFFNAERTYPGLGHGWMCIASGRVPLNAIFLKNRL